MAQRKYVWQMYAFLLLSLILLPLCAQAEEWDLDRASFFHFVTVRKDICSGNRMFWLEADNLFLET